MALGHGRVFTPRLRFVRYGRIATKPQNWRDSAVGYSRPFGGAGFTSGAGRTADAGMSGLDPDLSRVGSILALPRMHDHRTYAPLVERLVA